MVLLLKKGKWYRKRISRHFSIYLGHVCVLALSQQKLPFTSIQCGLAPGPDPAPAPKLLPEATVSILGKVGGPLDHPSLSQAEGGSENPGGAPPSAPSPRRPGQVLGFSVGSFVESRRPSFGSPGTVLRFCVSRAWYGGPGSALSHSSPSPCARRGRRAFPLPLREAEAQKRGATCRRAPPVSAGLWIGVIGFLREGPALEQGPEGRCGRAHCHRDGKAFRVRGEQPGGSTWPAARWESHVAGQKSARWRERCLYHNRGGMSLVLLKPKTGV